MQHSSADIMLLSSLNTFNCPIGVVPTRAIYSQLFELMPKDLGSFCIKKHTCKDFIAALETTPSELSSYELMLHALFASQTIECMNLDCQRVLKRDLPSGIIRTARGDFDSDTREINFLIRIKDLLMRQSTFAEAAESFEHFAADIIAKDL